MNTQSFYIFISTIIIISYLSNIIYKKTRIPDIIWLLTFGTIIGPVLGIINTEFFVGFSPIINTLSIILITFEAGIDVDLQSLVQIFPKTLALTLLTFISIVLGTTLIGPRVIPEMTPLKAAILGTILGGLSTIAVVSIRNQVQTLNSKNAWSVLALESTIVDPFRVILAITLIQVTLSGSLQASDVVKDILFIFIVGSAIGLLIGVAWSSILHRIRMVGNNYMITLAILLQVYYLSEFIAGNGGGTLACFFFGFIISNQKMVNNWIGFTPRVDIRRIIAVNKEIGFALKSYYFAYTGLIVSLNRNYIWIGLVLTVMIILVRFFSGSIIGHSFELPEADVELISLTYPLGTSALVFSQLPLLYDTERVVFTNPLYYVNIVFPVVLGTIIFSSLVAPYILKKSK
jgi:NhaP-type Na+/H+ or K+/H+ antiporter